VHAQPSRSPSCGILQAPFSFPSVARRVWSHRHGLVTWCMPPITVTCSKSFGCNSTSPAHSIAIDTPFAFWCEVSVNIMLKVLFAGTTHELGCELTKQYARREHAVHGAIQFEPLKEAHQDFDWISGVDVAEDNAFREKRTVLGRIQDPMVKTSVHVALSSVRQPGDENDE